MVGRASAAYLSGPRARLGVDPEAPAGARTMRPTTLIALGASLCGLAVVLGAFGAHALKESLEASGQLANWHTAVRYQVWHGLALILCGALAPRVRVGRAIGICFCAGALLFSGSIYGLALGGPGAVLGPITPLGGLLLIVGWALLASSALRAPHESPANR